MLASEAGKQFSRDAGALLRIESQGVAEDFFFSLSHGHSIIVQGFGCARSHV